MKNAVVKDRGAGSGVPPLRGRETDAVGQGGLEFKFHN